MPRTNSLVLRMRKLRLSQRRGWEVPGGFSTTPSTPQLVAGEGRLDRTRGRGASHQDIEENLLEVFRVLISQPARILLSPFSPRSNNFDLNFAWKGSGQPVNREERWELQHGSSAPGPPAEVPSPSTSAASPSNSSESSPPSRAHLRL